MERTVIDIEATANVLKLLGDKTRLTMIGLLDHGECCVCEFVEIFEMSQPSVSQHLRKLKDAGLVKERRNKHWVFYFLNKQHKAWPIVQSLLAYLPDQKVKLENLESEGLRISCCD